MEIHKRSTQNLYLDLYGETADDTPTATVYLPDGTSSQLTVTLGAAAGVTQRWTAVVGLAYTGSETDLKVVWSLSINSAPVSTTEYYQVVTPYLSIAQVQAIWPNLSDDAASDLEAKVRFVINAHCGQNFGNKDKTLTILGQGGKALKLPERLLTLTALSTLTTDLDVNNSIITGDGWYLKKGWTTGNDYHSTTNTYFGASADGMPANDYDNDGVWTIPQPGEPGFEKSSHGPVIAAPGATTFSSPWQQDYPFTVTGNWGWAGVPTQVIEAAKLLVNDYGCNEWLYRDRYLNAIKYADSQLTFSEASWFATGNVTADQLLSEYVILDWAVL